MGMLELSLWKPTWVILGRLLLAAGFGETPADPSEWFDTAVLNFSVAALMACTPILVHGFLTTDRSPRSAEQPFRLPYPQRAGSWLKTIDDDQGGRDRHIGSKARLHPLCQAPQRVAKQIPPAGCGPTPRPLNPRNETRLTPYE